MTKLRNVAIVGFASEFHFHLLPLAAGIALASSFYVLVGFTLVVRYDSINEYLFPSFVYTLAFLPPFVHYAGIAEGGLFYLHPLQAPLVLLDAAFRPAAAVWWLYGLLYSTLAAVLAFRWSVRAHARFVAAATGGAA